MKIPQYICTREEYPNIHKDAEGRAMPEVLGLCSLVAADSSTPGAVEAILIDKPAHKYLCGRGSLKGIDQVYANGKIKAAGWSVSYEDDGRTYITFAVGQGAKRISFNCRGYMYDAWNSANGYVQNPAYVLLFYLAFFVGVAQDDLNMQSFHDMAQYFVDQGWEENGKFIAQEQNDSSASLQELLVSFGLHYWKDTDGRIRVGRRDVSGYASARLIFQQIDILERPERPQNYGEAMNYLAYTWDNFPCSNVLLGSGEISNEDSIELLEEKRSELSFPWITSEAMALSLAEDELGRLAYGNPKMTIKLPFFWLGRINIFDVVAIQDAFGIKSVTTEARGYRKRIDIQTEFLDANLTDFPLYVRINADPDLGARCRADGFDIRFYASDGVTPLPYERESFAIVGGLASGDFWVKTNLATVGTYIYVYYGNPDAADGADPESVWDSNFKAVYHMKDATTSTTLDSTANDNDGTKKGANEPIEATGKIWKGQDFDGIDDYINSTPSISGNQNSTLEHLIYFTAFSAGQVTSMLVGGLGAGCRRFDIYPDGVVASDYWLDGNIFSNPGAISVLSWHHIAATYNGTTKILYVDGVEVASKAEAATNINSNACVLGHLASGVYDLDAILDEVRVSASARPAAWIKFEYHNIAEADNELTWWMEEYVSTEFGDEAWHYYIVYSIAPDFENYSISVELEDANPFLVLYSANNQPLISADGNYLIGA